MPQRLSFQLYTARNLAPVEKVLPLLARIGYQEVEGYGGVFENPAALRRSLDRNKLTMPTAHIGIDLLEGDRKRALDIASTLGVRHIYCPFIVAFQRPKTAREWVRFGKRMADIGHWLRSEGYSFGWHNHEFEFQKLPDGSLPFDRLLEGAPLLDWECDVAWVSKAVKNPIPIIKRYADRITSVHIKDVAHKGENIDEEGWADVGQGILDWPKILKTLENSRAMHLVIEHDNPNDLVRFSQRSFDFVKAL